MDTGVYVHAGGLVGHEPGPAPAAIRELLGASNHQGHAEAVFGKGDFLYRGDLPFDRGELERGGAAGDGANCFERSWGSCGRRSDVLA